MFKYRLAYVGVAISTAFGILLGRNRSMYRNQSGKWILSKSLVETGVIALGALFAPGFLIGVIITWIVRPIGNNWAKVIVGIITGIIMGVISTFAMEVVVLLSLFGIDIKTGKKENGALARWEEVSLRNRIPKNQAA